MILQTYPLQLEGFEKYSILFKFKEGENFNHRNTWSILRIKLKLLCEQNVEPDPKEIGFAFHRAGTEIGQRGVFCKGFAKNQRQICFNYLYWP